MNTQNAAMIRFNALVRKDVRALRETMNDPTRVDERPELIIRLRSYLKYESLLPRSRIMIQQVIKDAIVLDQRHWSQLETHRSYRDPYTGDEDLQDIAYLEIEPEGYIKFDDGEIMGYRQLRYILDIIEGIETHVRGDIEFKPVNEVRINRTTGEVLKTTTYDARVVAAYNDRVGWPEEEPQLEEDRGYQPPGFESNLTVSWDNIANVQKQYAQGLEDIAQCAAYAYGQSLQESGGFEFHFSMLKTPLNTEERYYLLESIASRISALMPVWKINAINYPTKNDFHKVAQWKTQEEFQGFIHDSLIKHDKLDLWAQDNWEDLHEADPADHALVKEEEAYINDDDLRQLSHAPIIRMPVKDLSALYRAKKEFPAPEKVRVEKRFGIATIYLVQRDDWKTIQLLLALVGLNITEKQAKQYTPVYQFNVLRALANGGEIKAAYAQAWKEFYRKPEQVKQTLHITGVNGMQIVGKIGSVTAKVHPAAINKFAVTLEPGVEDQIRQLLGQHPVLKSILQGA